MKAVHPVREMVLVVDKPDGPTSFDVVRRVKRLLPRGTKVGHGGSLDPFASGVLIVLIGRATKLSGALLNADKVYQATVQLGQATDSMDRTGQVTDTQPVPPLTEDDILQVLKGLQGVWDQIPPMYSAKKQNGVRLYALARQNIQVDRQPVQVNLHRLTLLKREGDRLEIEVHCSKGTYVRSLAEEIGRRLGTVAHLAELRRTECGVYCLQEACRLADLEENPLPVFESGFDHYVRLLRTEMVRKAPNRAASPLPTSYKDGNSLLI